MTKDDLQLYWLSFVDEGKFAGVCVVKASSPFMAVKISQLLGIDPGGEVVSIPIPEQIELSEEHLCRVLDKEEARDLHGAISRACESLERN